MVITKIKTVEFCDKSIFFLLCMLAFFLPISKAIIEITVGLSILLFLIKKTILKEGLKKSPLNLTLFVYLAVCFVSIFISASNKISARTFVAKIVENFFLFFLVYETLISKKRLNIFFVILFLSSTLIGIDGVYQFFTHKDFLRNRPSLDIPRIYASFASPNALGCYLNFSLSFLPVYFFAEKSSKKQKISVTVLFCLLFICLLLTVSRGAWLAFFCSAVLMSVFIPNMLVLFLIILLIIILLHPFCYHFLKERLNNIFTLSDIIDKDREMIWQSGWRMFMSRPWVGLGIGTFMFNFNKFAIEGYPNTVPYAHNCYLQIASEIGIFGLISFLAILFIFFYRGAKALLSKGTRTFNWYMLLASLAAALGYSAQMSVDTIFYNLDLGALFWLMLGIGIVSLKNLEVESRELESNKTI